MENMNYLVYVLYVCIAVPIALMLLVLDKKNRFIILYLLFGITAGLLVGRVNRLCTELICGNDFFWEATNFGPIIEETAKGLPVVLLCTFAKNQSKKNLLACAYASGLGFAIFENVVYFCNNHAYATFLWAFFRGIGAGLMHSICTSIIAFGIIFMKKYKKLYWCGLVSFASFAMVYHGIFNSLVSSSSAALQNVGIFMPICTLVPIAAYIWTKRIKDSKSLDKA